MADGPFRLDGKVALVTGGGQGIGKAICLALADAGAAIAVVDLPSCSANVDAVCAEITQRGGKARGYGLDVSQVSETRAVVNQAAADFGRLDVLVNNAGVRERKPSIDVTEQEWDAILGVNLKGLFFCAQAAAAHMLRQGEGRIINVSSQLAVTAGPERAAYCASKGGVVSLTKSLALEWARSGITVNAVGPGPTETPMTANSTPETDAATIQRSPMGRRLTADEVAGAVVFLAGPAASAITGHHLLVDGGWTAG